MRRLCLVFLASLALSLVAGCGGSSGSDSGTGTLAIRLSDAPDPTITALNLTIPKVEANIDGTWTEVATPNATYNLLDLAKADTLLGQANLPAGRYSQVRLFVSSASVTDGDGTHNVVVPSGTQTGFKINLDYTVTPNEITEILLDFNVDKSLVKEGMGAFRLQPVVPAVVKVLSGTISGTVSDGTTVVKGAGVTATYTAGSAYPIGTEVNGSWTGEDGTFKVWALLPGTYRLNFAYTAPGTSTTTTAVVNDVAVQANQNSAVGTVTLG